MLTKSLARVALGTLPLLVACGSSKPPAPPPKQAALPAKPVAPAAGSTASISGKISFDGQVPAADKIRLTPECTAMHPNGLERQPVKVKDGGLADVYVYVKSPVSGTYPAPTTPAVLDQKDCNFSPHIVALQVGQPLTIRNSDEMLDNAHPRPKINTEFNIGQPLKGMEASKTFDRAEVMIPVTDDVHPWKRCYISVAPNPFFAVTAEDGSFTINNLPAGEYAIEAVHETLGTRTAKVTVKDGEAAKLDLTLAELAAKPVAPTAGGTASITGRRAQIIRVPEDQPTIQAGLDAASDGDTVSVAPGTYSLPHTASIGGFNYSLRLSKAVRLKARTLLQAVLDGASDTTVLVQVTAAATIEGFVFQNAFKGIQQRDSPDVAWSGRNLVFRNLTDTAVDVNATAGRLGSAAITNVVVDQCGRGFDTNDANSIAVENAVVMNTTAAFVGYDHNSFTVSYSILYNNQQDEVGDPVRLGPGVIHANPRVLTINVPAGGLSFPYAPGCPSPAVDAGNPATQFNDVSFPPSLGGSRNDIGAYGGPAAAVSLSTASQEQFLTAAGCRGRALSRARLSPTSVPWKPPSYDERWTR